MKHPSLKLSVLIPTLCRETVLLGQFKWGACLNLWGHLREILNANSTNMLEHPSI